jgi:hypothetical protein
MIPTPIGIFWKPDLGMDMRRYDDPIETTWL